MRIGARSRPAVAPALLPWVTATCVGEPRRLEAFCLGALGVSGARAELSDAPLLIGRGTDAAIRLDDDYASTRHARVAAYEDDWFVEDLGSTNGTYIGSVRLTQPTVITLGTQIRIGKTILELKK